MRIAKRLLAVALVALMLVSACFSAAALPSSATHITNGVSYYRYSLKGASSGITTYYNVMKFNTSSGLIPLAYSGAAGKTMSVAEHVAAAKAEGYEVVGAINASFFNMTKEYPCSSLITNGRLIFSTALHADVFTGFTIDGTPRLIQGALRFTLNLKGTSIIDGIGLVNKPYIATEDITATISNKFHYYDSEAGYIANTGKTGYEVLCEKLNGTDLKVGTPLEGKVLSITNGYYGKTIPSNPNQFVLFVRSDSTAYSPYVNNLSVGSTVGLSVDVYDWNNGYTTKNDWNTTQLAECHSAICDTYWLARNGVNFAATESTIGHSTTYSRPWTAFGWDNNGNYYYMATEGEKATLRDVTAELLAMGAVNVVRLDGGGSTAMYVDGKNVVYQQGRDVVDVLLIIKTPANITLQQTLEEAKNMYVGDISADACKYLNQAYDAAFDVAKKVNATNAEYKTADTNLKNAMAYVKNASNFPGKDKLNETDFLFVTDVNARVATGYASVFTNAFNNGTVTVSTGGYGFCYNLVCKPLARNKYEVVEQINRPGTNGASVPLENGYIMVSVNKSGAVNGSAYNAEIAQKCVPGTILTFSGYDLDYNYVAAGAFVQCEIPKAADPDPEPDPNPNPNPDPDPNPEKQPVGLRGDVNKNGEIDSRDYVQLKRAYFKTAKLDAVATKLADVNNSGDIDSRDYVTLKRVYFKTAKIAENLKYVY